MTQYRFLKVGEIIKEGDEVEYGDGTFHQTCCDGIKVTLYDTTSRHYRRRIHKTAKPNTAKEVKQKPTYRFLNYGETVLATDEWAQSTENYKDWEPVWGSQVGITVTQLLNKNLKYRRKVEAEVVSVPPISFIEELRSTINRHSKENGSNTPDFILAELLNDVLNSYDKSVKARDKWYGKELSPGGNNK